MVSRPTEMLAKVFREEIPALPTKITVLEKLFSLANRHCGSAEEVNYKRKGHPATGQPFLFKGE
jgi:hypothetical protein